MRRLQTDGCLTVYDMPHNGRNRRYYRITERGINRYGECKNEWESFKRRIDEFMGGGQWEKQNI
jgi:PadR family transcriptional regulator PadR